MAFAKVVEGSEIYNFPIHHFVHFYSKFWSKTRSNSASPTHEHSPDAPTRTRRDAPPRACLRPRQALLASASAPLCAPSQRVTHPQSPRPETSSDPRRPYAPRSVRRSVGGSPARAPVKAARVRRTGVEVPRVLSQ
jgi:hypothetical protein